MALEGTLAGALIPIKDIGRRTILCTDTLAGLFVERQRIATLLITRTGAVGFITSERRHARYVTVTSTLCLIECVWILAMLEADTACSLVQLKVASAAFGSDAVTCIVVTLTFWTTVTAHAIAAAFGVFFSLRTRSTLTLTRCGIEKLARARTMGNSSQ